MAENDFLDEEMGKDSNPGLLTDADFAPSPSPQAGAAPQMLTDADFAAQGGQPGAIESTARGLAQGASFGFADELAGAGEAAYDKLTGKGGDTGIVDLYTKHRDESRAAFEAARAAHPHLYTLGELGGTVGTTFIPGLGWMNAGKGAKLAQLAGKGALQAGLYGAGGSTADLTKGEVGQFAEDTGKSAALGGVMGGTLGKLSQVAPKVTAAGVAGVLGAEVASGGDADAGDLTKGAAIALTILTAGKMGSGFINKVLDNTVIGRNIKGNYQAGVEGTKLLNIADKEKVVNQHELIAQKVAEATDKMGPQIKDPAMLTVGTAYAKTLEDVGTQLGLKADELTKFVADNLTEFGTKIGNAEEAATKSGTKLDIVPILQDAKAKFEQLRPASDTGKSVQKNLTELFQENLIKEQEKLKVKNSTLADASGQPLEQKTTISSKGRAIDELPQVHQEAISSGQLQPTASSIETKSFPGNENIGGQPSGLVKTTQTNTYTPSTPVDKIGIPEAKQIMASTGEQAGNPNLEGQVRAQAADVYSKVKTALGDTLGEGYKGDKSKYAALKRVLETSGVQGLESDPTKMGAKLTPDEFVKVFEKIGKAVKESDFNTVNRMFDDIAIVDPVNAPIWKDQVMATAKQQNTLVKGVNAPAVDQAGILQQMGKSTPEVDAAAGKIQDIDSIQKQAGTLDPNKRTAEGTLLPENKTRSFVSDIGDTGPTAKVGRASDIEKTIDLIKKHDPETGNLLDTEGRKNARNLRLVSEASEQEGYAPKRIIFGTAKQIPGIAGNAAGLGVNAIKNTRIVQLIQTNPEVFGPYAERLKSAAQRGPSALAAANYILSQRDPHYRDLIDEINRQHEEKQNQ